MDLINRFVISSAAALAAMPLAVLAEALPTDPLERQCWLQHTRERTRVKLVEPTAVDVSNLRNGATVSSPFRVDFSVRGMGVIPAGSQHPRAGHHHLLLNTPLPTDPREKIPFNDAHRHFGKGQTGVVLTLPAGTHTIRLLFADHDHRPYYVYSPELKINVRGPRASSPLRVTRDNFDASCRAWYDEELARPRPAGTRALITNLRAGEIVTSPFNVRLAVDGFGVAPKGRGSSGLGHFRLDVLNAAGAPQPAVDLTNGATQATLPLPPGAYTLRLRFVDDSGTKDLVPPTSMPVEVSGTEHF